MSHLGIPSPGCTVRGRSSAEIVQVESTHNRSLFSGMAVRDASYCDSSREVAISCISAQTFGRVDCDTAEHRLKSGMLNTSLPRRIVDWSKVLIYGSRISSRSGDKN
jgi:hypothetical protein